MIVQNPEDVARILKTRRKASGLAQAAVAERAAMRQSTVSNFETQPNNARLDTLLRLCANLGLEVHLRAKEEVTDQGSWPEPW